MSDSRDLEVVVTFRPTWRYKPSEPLTIHELTTDIASMAAWMPEREFVPEKQLMSVISRFELRSLHANYAWSRGHAWRAFLQLVERIKYAAAKKAERSCDDISDVAIFWQGARWGLGAKLRDALFPLTSAEQFAEALADAERAKQRRAQE